MTGMPGTATLEVPVSFVEAAIDAARAMIDVIRPTQTVPRGDLEAAIKGRDETIVTAMDRLSGQAGLRILRQRVPGIRYHDEELGEIGGLATDHRWLVWTDPLDGTKSYAFGAGTETVIIALYDTIGHHVAACVIGHPATGRIWVAQDGQPTRVIYTADQERPERECRVWDGQLTQGGALLFDHLAPFKARGGTKLVHTRESIRALTDALIHNGVDIMNFGSNGFHHALVADQTAGSPKGVAAALTTALGGEWDACFALGVIRAGGCAVGFKVVDDDDRGRKLELRNPLDPVGFDMLLTANNPVTLQTITEIIMTTFV